MITVERTPPERLDEWLDLRNRIEPDNPIERWVMESRLRRDPHHVDLLARVDGAPAGVAVYGRMIEDVASRIGRINVRVLPEHRRRGVATALHRAVSDLGRPHGDGELEGQVVGPTEATEAYAAARGYRRVLRMIESRLDLTGARAAANDTCHKLVSAADDPAVLRDAYRVALEAEPDVPDAHEWVRPSSYEEWRAREIDDVHLVPHPSLVLYVDDEPAAYGLVTLERAGVGAHRATGVARAHRGRGLATALKHAQIERAAAAGLRELVAWNEEGNHAIRRVNQKLGYRIVCDVITYRGPLLEGRGQETQPAGAAVPHDGRT